MASRTASLTIAVTVLLAAPLTAQQTPVALQVDVAASHIYVVTHRTGLLSFLGHEHVIRAPAWRADVCWDARTHETSKAVIVIDARALDIDADSARTLARLGKGPSAQQRAQIHRKLHDLDHLATAQYPELRFESTAVRAAGEGRLNIRGRLTIRDNSREVDIPMIYQVREGGMLWLTGTLEFRQSTFGIKPESIAGVVKVADVVDLHVGLLASVTERGC